VVREILDVLGSVESLVVPGFGGVLVTGDLIAHIRGVLDDLRDRGTIADTLTRAGIAPDRAADLERAVHEGQILVVVSAE
jgi:hypothetical protein